MKRSSLLNRLAVGALVASTGLATSTYLMAQGTGAPAAGVAATGPATTSPSVLAAVNGQEIDSEKFESLLMAVAGMRLLEQVIDLIVVEQACRQAGIPVDGEEFKKNVQAELDRAYANLGAQGVEEKFRPQALSQILQRQGISNPEFEMGLRRAACLRALSKGKIVPTEKNIEDLYQLEHGERVRGRLFAAQNLEQASEIRKLVEEQKMDPNAAGQKAGVQVQPVAIAKTNDQKELKALKDASFSMKEGTLSAAIIQEGGGYLIFFLDKKEPASTTVKLDAALKEKLRERIIEQGEISWGQQHLQRLRSMANIKINDPILSQQYGALIARMRAAQTQAASQPAATAPAPK